MDDVLCPVCKEPFTPSTRGRDRVYCSSGCQFVASSRRKRARLEASGVLSAGHPTATRKPAYVPASREGQGNPLTADVIYDDEQREFLQAVEAWKKANRKPYPTCCDLLAIAKAMGYRKVEPEPQAKE